MKKYIILLAGIALLVLGIGLAIIYLRSDSWRKLTFEECEKVGGMAWRVDLYDPDICPSCAEYRACETVYSSSGQLASPGDKTSDMREICQQIIPCTECLNKNSPYPDSCPEGKEKIGEISDAAIWFQCCK